MTTLELFLIVFGIFPVLLIFTRRLSLRLLRFFTGWPPNIEFQFQASDGWYALPRQAPWTRIGGSTIRLIPGVANVLSGAKEPQFSTLNCNAFQTSKAKWRLSIEFEVRNPRLNREIVIDDIHAYIFEKDAFAPLLLTISFYGDVWLKQDNTILKEKRDYSLASGNGYIINLLFEVSRVEAAPAYGSYPHEKEGQVGIIFGLLLDYYIHKSSGLERRTIPSDSIYVFQFPNKEAGPIFKPINNLELQYLRKTPEQDRERDAFITRLETYLSSHLAFRPTPKP